MIMKIRIMVNFVGVGDGKHSRVLMMVYILICSGYHKSVVVIKSVHFIKCNELFVVMICVLSYVYNTL